MLTQLLERWTSDELTVNGRLIHYIRTGGHTETGEAKPPLLLVHGFTDDGRTWARLAHDLEDQYDVLMPDSYGHGTSARIDTKISFHDMVADLIAALDILGIAKITALGHSMGAGVVALAAAHHPDRFKAIILEDPVWLEQAPPEEARGTMIQKWLSWLTEFQTKSREEAALEVDLTKQDWDSLDRETFVISRQSVDIRGFEQIDWAANHAWQEVVTNIQCPFLLLRGECDLGGYLTSEVVAQVTTYNNQCHPRYMPGTGHHLHRENYAEFLAAVCDFLQERE